MSPETVIDIFYQAHMVVVVIVLVIVCPGLIVGLLVALFQATTQINEQTLSFLPKLIITLLTVSFTGHWMVAKFLELFEMLFLGIPGMIG